MTPITFQAMPKVSVVVPAFNTAKYLPECLDSLLGQTLSDVEIVCIDDGSSDRTADILAEYARKDARIRFFSQENRGLSASRNRAVGSCRGDYLLFCDSDDKLKPDALLNLTRKADAETLDILFFSGETFFDDGDNRTANGANYDAYYTFKSDLSSPRPGANLLADMVSANEFRSSACMQLIRRGHLEESGIRFFDGILHEDNLFTFENLLSAKRAARVNDPWYLRRMRADSIMTAPKRLENVVGYAVCAREMLRFARERPLPPAIETACAKLVTAMVGACRRVFDGLSPDEAARLEGISPLDRLWIDIVRRSRSERDYLAEKNRADRFAEQLEKREDELRLIRRSLTFRSGSALLFVPKTLFRLFKK